MNDAYDSDLERGLQQRRQMLGDAWVDQSLAKATDFSADFQNFITRYAWNEVWGRPGLEPKTRRIIVLAVTAALGRWDEFELHLRAALGPQRGDASRFGLTPDEVKEVLIQVAIYAGVPAANTAMAAAVRVMHELALAAAPASVFDVEPAGQGRAFHSAGTPALHYTVREARSAGAPRHTLVFGHALGADGAMWDAPARDLVADCRVVCIDLRGHGQSEAPPGPYTMAAMADDVKGVLDELQARCATGPVVWVGLSLGGMVGQELALRHPAAVKALVIANSTAGYPHEARAVWMDRIGAVESKGIEATADAALQRWFSPAFHSAQPAAVARSRRRLVSTSRAGYLGACHAVMNMNTADRLGQILQPALVVAGELDQGTPLAMSAHLAKGIPNAQLAVLPAVAHFSVLEDGAGFTMLLRRFIAGLPS